MSPLEHPIQVHMVNSRVILMVILMRVTLMVIIDEWCSESIQLPCVEFLLFLSRDIKQKLSILLYKPSLDKNVC